MHLYQPKVSRISVYMNKNCFRKIIRYIIILIRYVWVYLYYILDLFFKDHKFLHHCFKMSKYRVDIYQYFALLFLLIILSYCIKMIFCRYISNLIIIDNNHCFLFFFLIYPTYLKCTIVLYKKLINTEAIQLLQYSNKILCTKQCIEFNIQVIKYSVFFSQ